MPFAKHLKCPVCEQTYSLHNWREDTCGYRLRIIYDQEERNEKLSKQEIMKNSPNHWKYWKFFPIADKQSIVTIGEGGTQLVKSKRLADLYGLEHLYFKLELSNPSGSFKDRPISVGVSMAKENNAKVLSAASSGNAAASLSSLGAKSGIKTVVFVPERASTAKIAQLITLGATVVRVSGGADSEGDPSVKLFNMAVNEWNWTPSPSFGPFNPHQFEGTKSMSYEIIEQLDWDIPDWIIANTGSGGLLGGMAQGFKDWFELDWIEKRPHMAVIQPEACSPVVKAFKDKVDPLEFDDQAGFPDTVAGGLADPHPWDGDTALQMLYETNGAGIAVRDSEILKGQKLLASMEGIFASPSGVAAIAGLKQLVNNGTIDPSDTVVVPITGHGLKDPDILKERFHDAIVSAPSLDQLQIKLSDKNFEF